MQPLITVENATDFRTPDGIRVVKASKPLSDGSLYLTFEDRFALSRGGMQSQVWYVRSNGHIPSSLPAINLVYDPISSPWVRPAPVNPASATYFYVFNPGVRGHKPTFKHPSEVSAVRAANRLSQENPGETFLVLKALCMVQTAKPVKPAAETTYLA